MICEQVPPERKFGDLSAALAHGSVESKALPYDSDAMAMTEAQRQAVFGSLSGAPTNTELETEGK